VSNIAKDRLPRTTRLDIGDVYAGLTSSDAVPAARAALERLVDVIVELSGTMAATSEAEARAKWLAESIATVDAIERARVLAVLDGWRTSGDYRRTWTMGWRNACVLRNHDMATGGLVLERYWEGSTPDAARAAAAKAIEAGEV